MDKSIKESIWKQFGASLEMLENAINLCTNDEWDNEDKFWYKAFHCTFWTDYYLSTEPNKFSPPTPFNFSEFEGKLPDRVFTKEEVMKYLKQCSDKAYHLIGSLDKDLIVSKWENEYKKFTLLEILLYNMRHIQHHAAQLNLLLRLKLNDSPQWVSQSKLNLN